MSASTGSQTPSCESTSAWSFTTCLAVGAGELWEGTAKNQGQGSTWLAKSCRLPCCANQTCAKLTKCTNSNIKSQHTHTKTCNGFTVDISKPMRCCAYRFATKPWTTKKVKRNLHMATDSVRSLHLECESWTNDTTPTYVRSTHGIHLAKRGMVTHNGNPYWTSLQAQGS